MKNFAPLTNTFTAQAKIVENPSCAGGSGHAMTTIIREGEECTP